jgi:hypothetical protein
VSEQDYDQGRLDVWGGNINWDRRDPDYVRGTEEALEARDAARVARRGRAERWLRGRPIRG